MAKLAATKKALMAVGIVVIIFSSSLMILFLGTLSFGESLPRQIHVACVGDSITEGSGYPENLQVMLGANYKVGNFGVSGSTVLANSTLPYISQQACLRAKAFQPSVVVILLGTNDAQENTYESIDAFSQDYKKLINEYQSLESSPDIWLVTPPPIFANNMRLSNTNLEQGVLPCIEQVAIELDLPLIDVNTVLTGYPDYFGDGVHPNSEAAMLIANEISQALTSDGATAE